MAAAVLVLVLVLRRLRRLPLSKGAEFYCQLNKLIRISTLGRLLTFLTGAAEQSNSLADAWREPLP